MTEQIKCNALNADGKQCKNRGVRTVKYHGDKEIYSWSFDDKYTITWVKIKVCKHHYEGHFND